MSDISLETGAAATAAAPQQFIFHLPFGYPDKDQPETVHKKVTIARRPQAKDFFFETDGNEVEYDALLQAASITEFGGLRMPAPLTVLLSLNRIDREVIKGKMLEFMAATLAGREREILGPGKVKLAFSIPVAGADYDIVEFGKLLTGYDEIEIAKQNVAGWARRVATFGREITKVRNSQTGAESDGPIPLESMQQLDWFDLLTLTEAEGQWLDSFRTSAG
jgi:hypothetical protein